MCQRQQPDTDPEMRLIGGVAVDIEPDVIAVSDQTDHSTLTRKVVHFAHCQNACAIQSIGNHGDTFAFGVCNKQDVTTGCDVGDSPGTNRTFPNQVSLKGFLEQRTKWIGADHANNERSGGVSKSVGGPVHKLGEVEQDGGFDAILLCALWQRLRDTECGQKGDEQYGPAQAGRHDRDDLVEAGHDARHATG